jgi:hypothetical protein
MSNVNIRRVVENIRANTTVYTPIVEVIVNAIQAIDEAGRTDGRINVKAIRSPQSELDGLPEIMGFIVEDNGVGFTDPHRNSFDTLYTDQKIEEGGKGFGRFTCLKYFEDVHVASTFLVGADFRLRSFSMGKGKDIIVHEKTGPSTLTDIGTAITLQNVKRQTLEKKLSTVGRNLVERILPYFITTRKVGSRVGWNPHGSIVRIPPFTADWARSGYGASPMVESACGIIRDNRYRVLGGFHPTFR